MSTPVQSPAQALPRLTAALAAGRPCRLTVTGNSMVPFLRHHEDVVWLERAAAPFRRGDILLYLRGTDTPILHRVHRVERDGRLLMCGDAQRALEPIDPQQVLARVTHIERGGKKRSCAAPLSRLGVELWLLLRPVRRYILGVLRRCGLLK